MKTAFLTACAALLLLSPAMAQDTYKVDRDHSIALFRIKHLGVSFTYGRFNELEGTIVLDEANPEKSSVELVVKATSLDTNQPKRDEHLRGPDFFNVKQFPEIRFKSKSWKKSGESSYQITGDLTLHGVTKEITVNVDHTGSGKDPWGGFRSGFELVFTIKRSDFDMKYMLGGPVGDEVRLTVSVEGVKQ